MDKLAKELKAELVKWIEGLDHTDLVVVFDDPSSCSGFEKLMSRAGEKRQELSNMVWGEDND